MPETEACETPCGETEASGLTLAFKIDDLSGVVASSDLFLKGKVVSTFLEGNVSGLLLKSGRTTLFQSMNLIPPNLKESGEYLGVITPTSLSSWESM